MSLQGLDIGKTTGELTCKNPLGNSWRLSKGENMHWIVFDKNGAQYWII